MPIQYKKDILKELKEKGYNPYRIRQEKLMGEAAVQQLREGKLVSWKNIDVICTLLGCQPGDILYHVKGDTNESN